MDNEREDEISEETLRLARDLGERLARDADASPQFLQFRQVSPSLSDLDDRLEARIDSILRELEDIEGQIRILEDRTRIRDLQERRWMLRSELEHLQRRGPSAPSRLRMDDSPPARGRTLPDYLGHVELDIIAGSPGAYWLHGEDARERARAVDAIAARLAAGGKLGWVTAIVDLSRPDVRRRDRPADELGAAVRRAWDEWTGEPAGPPLAPLDPPITRRSYAGRAGAAIILTNFPARKKKAERFLAWLASGTALSHMPLLVFVSTDSPPAQDSPYVPVLCETGARRLGRRVAALRLKRGWNRAELAERADFPRSMIIELEAGLRERWDERILLRVAGALGVGVEELG